MAVRGVCSQTSHPHGMRVYESSPSYRFPCNIITYHAQRGISFESVGMAYEIFDLDHFVMAHDDKMHVKIRKDADGSCNKPQVGFVIYCMYTLVHIQYIYINK
jgi:hypothetical protein